MEYKKVPLCVCNNCKRLYEDTNPKEDATEFKVPKKLESLQTHNDMRMCPHCETDAYLSDVGITPNWNLFIENEFPILNELLKWCRQGIIDSKKVGDKDKIKMFVHLKKRIYKEVKEL